MSIWRFSHETFITQRDLPQCTYQNTIILGSFIFIAVNIRKSLFRYSRSFSENWAGFPAPRTSDLGPRNVPRIPRPRLAVETRDENGRERDRRSGRKIRLVNVNRGVAFLARLPPPLLTKLHFVYRVTIVPASLIGHTIIPTDFKFCIIHTKSRSLYDIILEIIFYIIFIVLAYTHYTFFSSSARASSLFLFLHTYTYKHDFFFSFWTAEARSKCDELLGWWPPCYVCMCVRYLAPLRRLPFFLQLPRPVRDAAIPTTAET